MGTKIRRELGITNEELGIGGWRAREQEDGVVVRVDVLHSR